MSQHAHGASAALRAWDLAPAGAGRLQAEFIGASAPFLAVLDQLRRMARSGAPVLIEGETGCGKEVAARALHYCGPRRDGPFVPVNCGALPDHLLEAELFGHARGAFTDAKTARRGLVAEANGGTLFLDEVDALSAKAQVTLLRFLQDQRYRPLGSSEELSSQARVIAAANRKLDDLARAGGFRVDLLYRLDLLHLRMPPLRERTGDAQLLVRHFLAHYAAHYGVESPRLDDATLAWIDQYRWPGNVRELQNWVQRRLLMDDAPAVGEQTLDALAPTESARGPMNFRAAKAEAVRRFERDYVAQVLKQAEGNVTRAAQLAGKERRAFGKLLKKHGLDRHADTGT